MTPESFRFSSEIQIWESCHTYTKLWISTTSIQWKTKCQKIVPAELQLCLFDRMLTTFFRTVYHAAVKPQNQSQTEFFKAILPFKTVSILVLRKKYLGPLLYRLPQRSAIKQLLKTISWHHWQRRLFTIESMNSTPQYQIYFVPQLVVMNKHHLNQTSHS